MSNSIWKTPKDSPRQEQLVAWVDRKGMHAGRFDTCYNCFCACAQYFVDLKKVKRWCSLENLDDLIAQADKAERLQKAQDALNRAISEITDLCTTILYCSGEADNEIQMIQMRDEMVEEAKARIFSEITSITKQEE